MSEIDIFQITQYCCQSWDFSWVQAIEYGLSHCCLCFGRTYFGKMLNFLHSGTIKVIFVHSGMCFKNEPQITPKRFFANFLFQTPGIEPGRLLVTKKYHIAAPEPQMGQICTQRYLYLVFVHSGRINNPICTQRS